MGDTGIAFMLPLGIVITYILGLRATNSFSDDDREIASRIDNRLGYSIICPIIS